VCCCESFLCFILAVVWHTSYDCTHWISFVPVITICCFTRLKMPRLLDCNNGYSDEVSAIWTQRAPWWSTCRLICNRSVHLHCQQHNDVIARIVSLGIRRQPCRGTRDGRKCNRNGAMGNPMTSQSVLPGVSRSRGMVVSCYCQHSNVGNCHHFSWLTFTNKLNCLEAVVQKWTIPILFFNGNLVVWWHSLRSSQ